MTHRVPAHAGHRGAGRDELLVPGPAGALHGRELLARPAQPLHAARRGGARRARLEQVHRRGDRALSRPLRRDLRLPPLAALGRATRRSTTSRPSATSTGTSTTRRSGSPTTGSRWRRSPSSWSCRRRCATSSPAASYYGTVSHNVKAVYQRYLGWFDGNPAHLNPHPPVEAARRYVDYMGGADAVLARARESFDGGRLPLGRRGGEPRRVRRSRQPRGPRAAGRRARAARLPGRVRPLALVLPHRGARASRGRGSRRNARGRGESRPPRRAHGRDGAACAGRPDRWPAGRRQA